MSQTIITKTRKKTSYICDLETIISESRKSIYELFNRNLSTVKEKAILEGNPPSEFTLDPGDDGQTQDFIVDGGH